MQSRKKMQTTSLDDATLKAITEYAEKSGLSISGVIRLAVTRFVKLEINDFKNNEDAVKDFLRTLIK